MQKTNRQAIEQSIELILGVAEKLITKPDASEEEFSAAFALDAAIRQLAEQLRWISD